MTELSLEEHGDDLIPLVVDGVKKLVPLKELATGGMLQADYTQKTQELAERAKQLDQASQQAKLYEQMKANLRNDPKGMLNILAQQAGVNINMDDPQQVDGEGDEMDPDVAALQQQINELTQSQTVVAQTQIIDREKAELAAQFGASEADIEAALVYARDHQMPPGTLAVAYKASKHDTLTATQKEIETKLDGSSLDDILAVKNAGVLGVGGNPDSFSAPVMPEGMDESHPDYVFYAAAEEAKAELAART